MLGPADVYRVAAQLTEQGSRMIEASIKSVQCISPAGLHRMAYKEWGRADNPRVLVCVHGVTRVSDDFDILAQALADEYRVICPDIVGRGRSGWLRDPQLYRIAQYVGDMVTLLARVLPAEAAAHGAPATVDWVGTSMGGLIGLGLAALPDSPVRKLVLNDIGPVLDPAALRRIGDYIGEDPRFASFASAAAFIRAVSAPFGPHSEAQWHKLASDVLRQDQDGQWHRHYDLGLALPFRSATPESVLADEALLWAAYDALTCPTLLLRGAQSDLLSRDCADLMTQRGPRATLVQLPGVGHAPTLVQPDQVAIVRQFLLAPYTPHQP